MAPYPGAHTAGFRVCWWAAVCGWVFLAGVHHAGCALPWAGPEPAGGVVLNTTPPASVHPAKRPGCNPITLVHSKHRQPAAGHSRAQPLSDVVALRSVVLLGAHAMQAAGLGAPAVPPADHCPTGHGLQSGPAWPGLQTAGEAVGNVSHQAAANAVQFEPTDTAARDQGHQSAASQPSAAATPLPSGALTGAERAGRRARGRGRGSGVDARGAAALGRQAPPAGAPGAGGAGVAGGASEARLADWAAEGFGQMRATRSGQCSDRRAYDCSGETGDAPCALDLLCTCRQAHT